MKVGLASTDWSQTITDDNGHPVMGGAGWARLGQYVDRVDEVSVVGILIFQNGIFGVRDWNMKMHWDCDVIVMQRVMFADVPDRIYEAQANGQVIINDLDDWYWGLSTSNGAWAASHPKNSPNENVNHYKKTLSRSDVVTVSTPYLADRVSQFVRCPIEVIPNFVDVSKFTAREVTESDVPTVGWVGSTAHRSGDLEILVGVLSSMLDGGKIRLHHSGHLEHHKPFAEVVRVPSDSVSTLPMAEPSKYPDLFTFDIGLVPLSDVPFNRAKSAIKGLEYASAGIPFIASDLDEYQSLHEAGIGWLAKKPRNWMIQIDRLRDPEQRRKQARLVRERVDAFDIRHGAKLWSDFYSSLT